MTSSTDKKLPRILCFHGGGSSGSIFRIQARKIEQTLRHHFRFVFINGPFKSVAGPGILPIFEGSGPYHRWHCDVSAASVFDITEAEIAAERRTVCEYLYRLLRIEDGAPFVGVMGFSQGTRVATGLLLEQQLQAQQQQQQQRQWQKNHKDDLRPPPLRFAVLLGGTYPPLPLTDTLPSLPSPADTSAICLSCSASCERSSSSESGAEAAVSVYLKKEPARMVAATTASPPLLSSSLDDDSSSGKMPKLHSQQQRIRIPSVHVHGLQDPWLGEARELLKNCYDSRYATLVEFQGGHHVPSAQKDIDELARAILAAYHASSDFLNSI